MVWLDVLMHLIIYLLQKKLMLTCRRFAKWFHPLYFCIIICYFWGPMRVWTLLFWRHQQEVIVNKMFLYLPTFSCVKFLKLRLLLVCKKLKSVKEKKDVCVELTEGSEM